jgi:hypothetical protein
MSDETLHGKGSMLEKKAQGIDFSAGSNPVRPTNWQVHDLSL